jgi:hypothetical protein
MNKNQLFPSLFPSLYSSRCVTCGRQVYVMADPGLVGAAIGGDAIAEVCTRKPSGGAVKPSRSSAKLG